MLRQVYQKDRCSLEYLDLFMADRGFQIDDILPNGVSLNLKSFMEYKLRQLTQEQVKETRRIASVRIHEKGHPKNLNFPYN